MTKQRAAARRQVARQLFGAAWVRDMQLLVKQLRLYGIGR